MKLIIFAALSLLATTSIAQENTSNSSRDSLTKKVEALERKVAVQDEELDNLKYENRLMRNEVSRNNLFRRGFGNRSRVVVDRTGSKQAHVVYY